jgi:hypothetical protein
MADRWILRSTLSWETGLITDHAGVPGLIEAFRQTGAAAIIDSKPQHCVLDQISSDHLVPPK